MPREKKPEITGRLVNLALPILIFVGGMAVNGFTLAEKVATKPYVDDKFVAAKVYTDEKAANTLKEAIEHSDANRQAMALQFQSMASDLKETEAKNTVKIDLVLEAVKNMRQDAWDQVHPRHRSAQ